MLCCVVYNNIQLDSSLRKSSQIQESLQRLRRSSEGLKTEVSCSFSNVLEQFITPVRCRISMHSMSCLTTPLRTFRLVAMIRVLIDFIE